MSAITILGTHCASGSQGVVPIITPLATVERHGAAERLIGTKCYTRIRHCAVANNQFFLRLPKSGNHSECANLVYEVVCELC